MELKESFVRDALLRLAKRQPLLRAVIKIVSNSSWFGQSNESYFKIIEPNKIGDMIDLTTSDVNASQWQKGWYDTVMSQVKTGLLWRAVLFAEEYLPNSEKYVNTIIFRVNHSIVDGVSGMSLCKQFLSHLNSVAENTQVCSEDAPSHELLPSFYEMINSTRSRSTSTDLQEYVGLHFICKFMKRLKLCISLASKPEKPYPFFMTQPSVKVCDLVYKVFSEKRTSRIRNVCRSKGVTVTGALMAAAHKAFCKLIKNQDLVIAKEQDLMHLFAINGVRFCEPNPPAEYVGNFVMSEMLPMSCNTEDFWSMAQEATKQIHTIIREGKDISANLAELDIFTPREVVNEFHSPLDPKKKLLLFIHNFISSAGAFTYDDSTSMYKLYECLYYSVPFGFASFASHFNTTVNGKMSWVIICSKFVPGKIEEQFAALCFDILENETR
ncbi:Hypothetical predicted protein [Paramuricea clavata]|uniref:Uncharacterized protein n=1 Tax=Paramuricea clavata TaxID=317549 RepID=A0A6S7L8L5_PARCT|nr:Hypothetical predicted protein [Paramuricea clavata]